MQQKKPVMLLFFFFPYMTPRETVYLQFKLVIEGTKSAETL